MLYYLILYRIVFVRLSSNSENDNIRNINTLIYIDVDRCSTEVKLRRWVPLNF